MTTNRVLMGIRVMLRAGLILDQMRSRPGTMDSTMRLPLTLLREHRREPISLDLEGWIASEGLATW